MEHKHKSLADIRPIKRTPVRILVRREHGAAERPPNILTRDITPVLAAAMTRENTQSKHEKSTGWFRKTLLIISISTLAISALIGTVVTVRLITLKATVEASVPNIIAAFTKGGNALARLETGEARESFGAALETLRHISEKAEHAGAFSLAEFSSAFTPRLKHISEAFYSLTSLGGAAFKLTSVIDELKKHAVRWITTQRGSEFIEQIHIVRNELKIIAEESTSLTNSDSIKGKDIEKSTLISVTNEASKHGAALDAFLAWLEQPDEKHLLILFQNPSELRPGGGFLGSYVELRLNRNGLQAITVWDTYDPDGQLDIAIIPPAQLQSITKQWGARDANWFFDFPTSAEKVISLLELSKIYREQHTLFDGAIAININLVRSILEITGPIELPEYNVTIGAENFLAELQREVESGRDKLAGEPKRILKVLTPILFEKIASLTDTKRRTLLAALTEHIARRDIMIYFKNPVIEHYLIERGVAGNVASLPENFRGEYLAVVSANVAGGKSDAFTNTVIKLSSKITADGAIDNYLILERRHNGDRARDAWYHSANRSYIKIFTPKGSKLTYLSGASNRTVLPQIDYETADQFIADERLQKIKRTEKLLTPWKASEFEESEKTVFGTWFDVKAGTTGKLSFQYTNPMKLTLSDGMPYRFVFERQSGASVSLDFLIEAPPGYSWKESGGRVFNYVDDDPVGHLEVTLTLVRDQEKDLRSQ